MGFRFHRSVRILPFLRLHFSRDGVSASLGWQGANVRLGRRGARGTVGIPGTGASYSAPLGPPAEAATIPDRRRSRAPRRSRAVGYFLAVLVLAFLVGASIALVWP